MGIGEAVMIDDEDEERARPVQRLRAVIEDDRLDTAALIWMVCVVALIGAQIWHALRLNESGVFSGYSSGWDRVLLLSQSGSIAVIVAIVIGVAVAAATDSRASRLASTLGIVAAAWEGITGFLLIIYAAFAPDQNHVRLSVSGSQILGGLAITVLGLLVAMAAWRIATSVPLDDEDADAEPEPAAVS